TTLKRFSCCGFFAFPHPARPFRRLADSALLALVPRYHLLHMFWNMLEGGISCAKMPLCLSQPLSLNRRADWYRNLRSSPQMCPLSLPPLMPCAYLKQNAGSERSQRTREGGESVLPLRERS